MSASIRIVFVSLVCLSFVLSGCASSPPEAPSQASPGPAQPAPESKALAAPPAQSAKVAVPVPESKAPAAPKPGSELKAASMGPDANDPSVVARIGDYTITKQELTQRLMAEIRPQSEEYTRPPQPVTAEGALLKMIGEKAMMLEGRKRGYLDDPSISVYIERQRRQRLGTMLVSDYVRENVPVDEAEIKQMIEKNPKATQEQARILVQRSKMMPVLEAFYKQLLAKFHVTEVRENFTRASEIYDRLLNHPATPRKPTWVQDSQVREELSDEERGLVLATYDGGQVTLQDWLEMLCNIVPPRRPKDLNTPDGVAKLLDNTLRPVILTAEAKARGYDKDLQYVRQMRDLEDRALLWKMQEETTKGIPEPNEEQIKEFFESHQDWFAEGPTLRVDQIWCQDSADAEAAKSELESGKDFWTVWKEHSLDAKNYTPPPARPSWLLYADEAAGLGGEKVTTQQLEQGGFKVTASRGRSMTVTVLDDGRIIYWDGMGQIEKVATKERFILPQPKPRDPFEMLMGVGSEGVFFSDLWKGEPNQVLGPVKGFYADGVRWRVVKVLAKTPAKLRPYSEQLANAAMWAVLAQRREAAIENAAKELREKYGYTLYAERIQGIDPLEVVASGPGKP
jgi:hypothetical protein